MEFGSWKTKRQVFNGNNYVLLGEVASNGLDRSKVVFGNRLLLVYHKIVVGRTIGLHQMRYYACVWK